MSQDGKSSPPSTSPNPVGLTFDPAHLLGVHSLAAPGLPFHPMAPLGSPYSLLAQPPAFPGLFGGLGAIPNPLHAAALSHSLAAASFYGLPKHPSELSSPPPPSSSPSHKKGKSSRSASSAAATSSSSSSSQRPSSSTSSSPPSSLPSYLTGWPLNGSSYHFTPPSAPEPASKTSSTSKRSRKSNTSSGSSSSNGSSTNRKIPHAHQNSASSVSLSIPTPARSSPLDLKSSGEKSAHSVTPDPFAFDPRAMITPYHMSPELAYLSQSLFLHRPDLGLPSPLLAASAAAAAASASGSTLGLEPGQLMSSSPSPSASKPSPVQSPSPRPGERKRGGETSGRKESTDQKGEGKKKANGVKAVDEDRHHELSHDSDVGSESDGMDRLLGDASSRTLPFDPNNPSHYMDDERKKRIADHIRRRVGMQDSMAALLSKHGIKHSDWLDHMSGEGPKPEEDRDKAEEEGPGTSRQSSKSHRSQEGSRERRRMREAELSDKIRLEAELQRQQEQLRDLQKRYSMVNEDQSGTTSSASHMSENEESKAASASPSTNADMDSQLGSESDGSSHETSKRGAEGSTDEGSPNKKRCVQLDERELTIPLEYGWNRQTIINGMGRRGIVGEVLYFAPCGKKMKTIPDVMRYLERNPNGDLGRENFSFNTKVNVGHFYEVRGAQGSTPVPLSDTEVLERIEMSRGKRARMQMLARKKREKAAREQALARQIMENKLKRRMELQEMSRKAAEIRFEKRLERQRQKDLEKKMKENQVLEKRKEKEHHKIMKQQEKIRLQEQLRIEREMRAQQIIEARNRRQQELEEMRLADAAKRNKERELKRQQLIIMKEQERERRRQHLLLIKALEQRKKQEEKQNKERLREEKLNEKLKQREMKMHQRRIEMEVAMELKKPAEDMELKNSKPLPVYTRLDSKLAGQPIADCMMTVEFLNNFGQALNLDKSTLPTLESMERGLLGQSEDDVEEFMSLVMHMLRFALDDVGVPNPKEAVTKLNQKITEMEMTDSTMSEILRIFIKARGRKDMSEWLNDKPMEALNPTKKAAIMAFLCNELLTSKVVSNEIDKHMEAINNLRRDKWIVEGQLRQMRVFQARKFNKIHKSTDRRASNLTNCNNTGNEEDTVSSSKMGSDDEDEKEDDDDKLDEEGSGNESDNSSSVMTMASNNPNMPFEPVDESMTRDESDKKIEKLRKAHAAFRQKVFRASLRLRAINVGEDRYKRTYWILPLTGGVYVEGMESGEPEEYVKENTVKTEQVKSEEDENKAEVTVKQEEESDVDKGSKIGGDESEVASVKKESVENEKEEKESEENMDNVSESVEKSSVDEGEKIVGDTTQSECSCEKDNIKSTSDQLDKEIENESKNNSSVTNVKDSDSRGDSLMDGSSTLESSSVIDANSTFDASSVMDEESDFNGSRLDLEEDESFLDESEDVGGDEEEEKEVNGSFVSEDDNVSESIEVSEKLSSADSTGKTNFDKEGLTKSKELIVSGDDEKCINARVHMEHHNNRVGTMDEASNDSVHEQTTAENESEEQSNADNGFPLDVTHKPDSTKSELSASSVFENGCETVSGKDLPSLSKANGDEGKMSVISSLLMGNGVEKLLEPREMKASPKVGNSDTSKFSGSEKSEEDSEMSAKRSVVTDILKVPKVGVGQRETLVSLLNHSISQAYLEGADSNEKAHVKSKPSNLSSSLSSPESLLSSSLLFSSIPKLPQPAHAKKGQPLPPDSPQPLDFTPKVAQRGPITESPSPLLGSRPLPAHSKPVSHQPLPPFHPSAQANPLLDLIPPAAHSSHASKKPPILPLPTHSTTQSTHQSQPPFIPGLSKHPYGPDSASCTLSSLASIVSPPPAHHQPAVSTSLPLNPSSTISKPLSSSSYSSIQSVSVKDPTYSSSDLLQQAATQALQSTKDKSPQKKTPPSSSALSLTSTSLTSGVDVPSKQSEASTVVCSSSTTSVATSPNTQSETAETKLWFSIFPRVPCDELSLTRPVHSTTPSTPYKSSLPAFTTTSLPSSLSVTSSSSLSGLTSASIPSISSLNTLLTSSASFDSLLPLLQANPSLLSQDSFLNSLKLLAQPTAPSPTPSVTGEGSEFKVPHPPVDNAPQYDPWDVLRAAQGEAKPIPKDKQHGWWRIHDLATFRGIMPCTLNRGIREKNLQRAIHRYHEYARLHCTYDSEKGETDPNAKETEPPKSKKKNETSNQLKKEGGYKKDKAEIKSEKMETEVKDIPNTDAKPKGASKDDQESQNDPNSNLSKDKSIASTDGESEDTENKMAVSSDDKTENDKQEVKPKTEPEEEADEKDKKPVCNGVKEEPEEEEVLEDFVPPDDPEYWSVPTMHEIELATLEEVETLEERIFHASLQAKQGWKPSKDNALKIVDRSVTEVKDDESYPLDLAISRLLELEANIERRYLKPPLMRSIPLNIASLSSSSDKNDGEFGDDEDIPPGLLLWRQAVVGSESPAQLSLCTQLLAKSIYWEKSIMRVTCQICRKDDNEAKLLLCDGCDKGYHTYCFKPKMENIPDGDWYCFECVSKASGTPHCVVCGSKGGKIVSCSKCPRCIHLECLDPPLPRMPKRWQCSNCLSEKGNSKRSRKRKENLPTVQRITITKLVIKEEPVDSDDAAVSVTPPSSSTTTAAAALTSSTKSDTGTTPSSSKKVENNEAQSSTQNSLTPVSDKKKSRKRKEKEPEASPAKKKEKKEKPPKKEKNSPKEKKEDTEKQKEAEEKSREKERTKDMGFCWKLLTELEKHEEGWPFQKPVSKKQFPSYKKYIKTPMDFSTARGKLKNKEYKHRQDFAADMRLIFNNCETFNEDDSEVGQAGHTMRKFFETRWLQIFPDDAP